MSVLCDGDDHRFHLEHAEQSWATLLDLLTDDDDPRTACLEPCAGDGSKLLERKAAAIDNVVMALQNRTGTETAILDTFDFCNC